MVIPSGEGEVEVISSTQHLSMVQSAVASCLKLPQNRVTCHVKRIGGGFGGKESRYVDGRSRDMQSPYFSLKLGDTVLS